MISLLYILLGTIVAIIIGFVLWRYLSLPYRIVLLLALIGLITEIIGFCINKYWHVGNAWLFNFYMPLEPVLLGTASIIFIKEPNYRKIVCLLLCLNFSIWLFEMYRYSIYNFANFAMIFGCFLLVVIYIFVLLKVVIFNDKAVLQDPLFWLCLSTILYFGCDIPYMGMYHYWAPQKLKIHLTNINQILNFIRYPLVAVSFVLAAREKKEELKNTPVYVTR